MDLLEAFEEEVDSREDEVAVYLRDPRVGEGETRYLALSVGELKLERDAWSHRLRALGVGPEDRVFLWLPRGLTLVAATYASLRIGAEVAVAEEGMAWGDDMSDFAPTMALVSVEVASIFKKRMGRECQVLEVRSSLVRVAAGVKSSRPRRSKSRRMISGVSTFREDLNGLRKAVRFDAAAISALLAEYRERLCIREKETDIPIDCLMSILAPAWGLASVFTEAGFGARKLDAVGTLIDAIEDLGVSRLTRSFSDWERILLWCDRESVVFRGVCHVFVSDAEGRAPDLLERFKRSFPNAEVGSVFGSQATPVAAVRKIEWGGQADTPRGEGWPVGQLLGGLRWQISPTRTSSEMQGEAFGGYVGELFLAGSVQATVAGEESKYKATGCYARVGESGDLWVCGRVGEGVHTSLGEFLPSQIEPVFEAHAKVRRAIVLGLRSKKSTRLGLLVEVEQGCLPKGALEESKLKAELLVLGAQREETKLILDMFFVDTIPNSVTPDGRVDRAALSRRYSMVAKLRALF